MSQVTHLIKTRPHGVQGESSNQRSAGSRLGSAKSSVFMGDSECCGLESQNRHAAMREKIIIGDSKKKENCTDR